MFLKVFGKQTALHKPTAGWLFASSQLAGWMWVVAVAAPWPTCGTIIYPRGKRIYLVVRESNFVAPDDFRVAL